MENTQVKDKIRILLTGLGFGESPRWHDGRLWFSNWSMQEIVAVDTKGNRETALRTPFDSFPFSIGWLPDGRLLILSASDQPLLRMGPDGSLVAHANLGSFGVEAWNEVVVDGRGNIYINGGSGVIVMVGPDGVAKKVAEGLAFPNGMVVAPDNSTLVIAESFGKKLTAFDISADGGLSNRRVWADLKDGVPDGICMDAEGAIWYGDVPNKRCVRVREGGEVLQAINLDRGCFACMLGGEDRKTLFMMVAEWHGFDKMLEGKGTGQVLTVEAPAQGVGWP